MAGIRKIDRGRDQYSDGTTIDGNRLDRTMEALIDRMSEIPKGDLRRRFMQNQIVSGLIPILSTVTAGGENLPFMPETNRPTQYADSIGDKTPLNTHRLKGVQTPDNADFYVWTASQYIRDPIVVSQIDVLMLTDSFYTNDWKYGTSPPAGETALAYIRNIHVHLTVDNPWAPESRAAGAVEVHRYNFRADAEFFQKADLASNPSVNMVPTHPGGVFDQSVHVHVRDINIPIHRDSRIRWSLSFPTGGNNWGANPVHKQYYTMVLTYLEEVKEGA